METDKEQFGWIEYDLFEQIPQLNCKTYLRHGGFSKDHFATLNVSLETGDHPDSVKANRELIKKDLKVEKLAFAKQRHGDNLIEVTKGNVDNIGEADGLYTKEKKLALAIAHADCQAAVFYAPKQNVLAVVHAGWKGQVLNIYQKMVQTLKEKYGVEPSDLLVSISPSLCPNHAEFKNYKEEFPEEFWSFQNKEKPKCFNLWKIAIMQLTGAGVREDRIEVAQSCTFCEDKDFYSYRRNKSTGRHATAAALL